MISKSITTLLNDSLNPVGLSIKEVASWMTEEQESRLLLPPIQRSVVWTNEQVINYWDSLLRGYPPGLMMVHHTNEQKSDKGVDAEGSTVKAGKGDFQLFDGQQRMTAILLGFGMGQLRGTRRLWIDLGNEAVKNNGLKYQLRINSIGQPFGYRAESPNQKIETKKRRVRWKAWRDGNPNRKEPKAVFEKVTGCDLIDVHCAISFKEILVSLHEKGKRQTISNLVSIYESADETCVENFVTDLKKAWSNKIIFQNVASKIVEDHDEYIRFFTRLGQGGTRLSDDELTYSIIKCNYPEIRDRMQEIMEGDSGRIAGEVDLVLAALRVAKVLKPWEAAKEWEITGRPSPTFVSRLKEHKGVEATFLDLIPSDDRKGLLKKALINIRKALEYDDSSQPKGLPALLLGQLPKELIDVLLLFTCISKATIPWQNHKETLCTFVLYWLFFISNDTKAAALVFRHVHNASSFDKESCTDWVFSEESIGDLLREFDREGIAHALPASSDIPEIENDVKKPTHMLRPWEDRFKTTDHKSDRKPGESLRVLSTTPKLISRALMWLQRGYIAAEFPDYDPTSGRDEDLPVDLDHLVPHDLFGFNWRQVEERMDKDVIQDEKTKNNFWRYRKTVGNSLGNFRWLSSSENRGRQNKDIEALPHNGDCIAEVAPWNDLILAQKDGNKWSKKDIAAFQRLIDLRTIDLFERLLKESGVEKIISEDCHAAEPTE